jgi:SAM-dependent methyltransferase
MEHVAPILFNRAQLRKRRGRMGQRFVNHDFLWREATERVEESLALITHRFPTVVGFGTHAMEKPAGTAHFIHCADSAGWPQPHQLVADEEFLPFAENSVDAVVSILSLQWVNDLPGALAQIQRMLKPDGLFMAILPGGETLRELRSIFAETESAISDGITPRISPFIDVRDGGALLQRAGFALPVADTELLSISYPNLFALMDDVRGSGSANVLQQRVQHFTPRGFFLEAAARYGEQFADAQGRITATMELVTLTAWKPSANQQQPAKRGSGQVSLKDVL